MRTFNINQLTIGNKLPFVLIAGPCQIESQDHAEDTCARLIAITALLGIPLIYKSSFDKANRSSITTKRGIGIKEGLDILNSIKHSFGVPVLTDIHESWQAKECAEAGIDILQIPAINPKLSQYIKLLIEKINPISKIKTLDHNIGISNYLYLYIRNLPNNKMLLKYINIYIETENLYNISQYILLKYLQLMKVFDNKKIFNNTNLSLYIKLHEKIYLKYLLQRKFLLDKLC